MKRSVALLVLLALLCSLTACGGNPTSQSISDVPESSQNAEEIPDTPLNTDPPTVSQSSGGDRKQQYFDRLFYLGGQYRGWRTQAAWMWTPLPPPVYWLPATLPSWRPGFSRRWAATSTPSWWRSHTPATTTSAWIGLPMKRRKNARPALASHVDNMEDYDIVFLGFPNWWYTLPMPVLTFVEEYDWSGKTVVPFVTHGTGGLSSTIRDLTAALPEDVTILEPSAFTARRWMLPSPQYRSGSRDWIWNCPRAENGQTQKGGKQIPMESTRKKFGFQLE